MQTKPSKAKTSRHHCHLQGPISYVDFLRRGMGNNKKQTCGFVPLQSPRRILDVGRGISLSWPSTRHP